MFFCYKAAETEKGIIKKKITKRFSKEEKTKSPLFSKVMCDMLWLRNIWI